MAERENKKKLTKEELHEENVKIEKDLKNKNYSNHEDQMRIVNTLRGKNLFFYALALLLPIVGVPLIWKKQQDLYLNNASVYLWTGVGVIVLIRQIMLIVSYIG